VVKAART